MKKQHTNNRLAFSKAAVTELNETQMAGLNGGTIASSLKCLEPLVDWFFPDK